MFKCDKCDAEFETERQLTGHSGVHVRRQKKADRSKRVPLGTPHRKLTADIPDGKVGRWVNDRGGRLMQAQRGGYEFVTDDINIGEGSENANTDLGSKISQVVGTKEDGTPQTSYLMVIDKDMYDADQAEKQNQVDGIDESIKQGALQNTLGDKGYTPEGGIQYNPTGQ